MTRPPDAHPKKADRRFLAALAVCCVGPMLLITVLASAFGVALGRATAITLGLVAVVVCVVVTTHRHR